MTISTKYYTQINYSDKKTIDTNSTAGITENRNYIFTKNIVVNKIAPVDDSQENEEITGEEIEKFHKKVFETKSI